MTREKTIETKSARHLYSAVLQLKTSAEVGMFLRDLCTREELLEMTKRWEAVRLLNEGKSYRDIATQTGLSTTTVTRVADWLKYGTGGYRLLLKRLKK